MGQRLVLSIQKDGKLLANSYYHWDAYTSSSLARTREVIQQFQKTEYTNDIDIAIDMLYATKAGFTDEDADKFFEVKAENPSIVIDVRPSIDRNTGLIAVDEERMQGRQSWSEGDVYVDIGTKTVHFDVINYISPDEYMIEQYAWDNDIDDYENIDIEVALAYFKEKAFKISHDISAIPFNDFDKVCDEIMSHEYIMDDGEIYGKIE